MEYLALGDNSPTVIDEAAARVVRGLPRDQAIGLRLMALARAAVGVHMGSAAGVAGDVGNGIEAQECAGDRQLLRSQAAGLVGMAKASECAPGSESRGTQQSRGIQRQEA